MKKLMNAYCLGKYGYLLDEYIERETLSSTTYEKEYYTKKILNEIKTSLIESGLLK